MPIKSEIDSIFKYEKAVNLLIDNKEKLDTEQTKNSEIYKKTGQRPQSYLDDSLYKVLQDKNLRFSRYEIKIDGKDTTITFKSSLGDFYMRGNHKDKEADYTIFWHSIVYTNKTTKEFKNEDDKDDTPSAVIKIKDKYYYHIWSGLEY